ncbi:MAG: hypothetical protein WKF78_11070 [Candidatus Limnocylindrales bacterium]
MKTKSKPTMNATIRQAIETILGALKTNDEHRTEYLKNPHPWEPERARHLAAFDAERERAIGSAAATIDRESSSIEAEYRKTRKTSFDAVEVAEAWRRCQELLRAGLGLADVVALPDFSREQASAIRLNARTYFTAALKGQRAETVETSVREILDLVDRAELPAITDRTEAYATPSASLNAEPGSGQSTRSGGSRPNVGPGSPPTPPRCSGLGHALSAEGFEATPRPTIRRRPPSVSGTRSIRSCAMPWRRTSPNGRTPRVMAAPIRRS